MKPDEFAAKMSVIAEDDEMDEEDSHVEGDHLMCEVLSSLGYDEGVRAWKQMRRWYS